MSRHTESLSGGLVNARDSALLQSGEVSQAQNAIYKPNSMALHRAYGKSAMTSAATTATGGIVGLRGFAFSASGSRYLALQADDKYWSVTLTGSLPYTAVSAETVTAGSWLDMVQYRTRQYLLNGANLNRVWYLNAGALSTRRHGLEPVVSPPATATAAGTFSLTVTGYYEYWVTEVLKYGTGPDSDEIEGTYAGSPATVYVSSTNVTPTITHARVNPEATHWRLYRSTAKSASTDVRFPAGVKIAEGSFGTATVAISDGGSNSSTALTLPSSAESHANLTKYDQWTNDTNALADDAAYAVATSNGEQLFNVYKQGYHTFSGFTSVVGNITGIEIEVQAKLGGTAVGTNNKPILEVAIGYRDVGSSVFDAGFRRWPSTVQHPDGLDGERIRKACGALTTSDQTFTLGGSSDTWLPTDYSWSAADLDKFYVVLIARMGGTLPAPSGTTIEVDYVKAKVYSAGSTGSATGLVPFRFIQLDAGGVTVAVGEDGPPPTSSTGDVFQDALVLNDVNKPSYVWYSTPGRPDSFPEIYYIDLGTNTRDRVQCLKTVGRVLVAGMTHSLWRINYLPSEDDAMFSRGRAVDIIDPRRGIVNPMAAALFSAPGGRTALAFVSYDGLYMTDGFSIQPLTDDIDWVTPGGTTYISNFNRCYLINNPTLSELVLFYDNTNSTSNLDTTNTLALHLSYHPSHLKGDRLKVSGPVVQTIATSGNSSKVSSAHSFVATTAAVAGVAPGTTIVVMGQDGSSTVGGGKVYYEDTSTNAIVNDVSTNNRTIIDTRRMYLAGGGNEWQAKEVYLYNSNFGTGSTLSATPLTIKTNEAEQTRTAKSFSFTAGVRLSKVVFAQISEGLRVRLQETGATNGNATNAWEHLVIDGEDFGEEHSGK